ncbi:MAG: NAD-dependent epimerase/dehydratase family protein [Defluviitaleaceae bacterium]|nr:NAD-dependent epimerase/dehydratase family protein [Defluviitaleaceae bacterium]
MNRVVITGANGFIGSAVVDLLISNNVSVVAMDMPGRNNNLPISPLVDFVPMDIADISPLLGLLKGYNDFDAFLHFAWTGSAGPERSDIQLQLNNVKWTTDCIRLCADINCKRFVCAGSIMENEVIAAAFTQGCRPATPFIYGSGKLAAHAMSKPLAAELGVDLLWAQITNAYGVGERSPRFINTTLRKIMANEPLQFTSGTQNYDFVYIDDIAKAFAAIAERGVPFSEYIIGSSHAKPLREFILQIKQTLAPDRDFIFGDVPFTGINLPLSAFDASLLEKDTGFKASISFPQGIVKTYNWLKEA